MRRVLQTALVLALLTTSALAAYLSRQLRDARGKLRAEEAKVAELTRQLHARAAEPAAPREPVLTELRPRKDPADAATIRALQEQNAAMRAQLSERTASAMPAQTAAPEPPTAGGPPERDASRFGPRAWLEDLKQNNPAQYAEVMKRREQIRERVQAAYTNKYDFMLRWSAAASGEEEKAYYAQMITLLNSAYSAAERLRAEDLPREDRHQLLHTVRESVAALEPMLAQERQKEWDRMGRELGYGEADRAELTAYLNDVIEVTSVHSLFRDLRGFGGRGGSRGGPPTPDGGAAPATAR